MAMIDEDLITDEELRDLLIKRYDAKELSYLFVWGSDDGEEFEMDFMLDLDQIGDITDLLLDEGEWQLEDLMDFEDD